MSPSDYLPTTESYSRALQEATQRYERLVQALSILRQLDQLDDPGMSLDEICRNLVQRIAFGLASENCSLMLVSETEDILELRAACSPFEERGKIVAPGGLRGRSFEMGEGIVGKVARSGEGIRIDDVTQNPDFARLSGTPVDVRSLMCFPLLVEGRTVGVLNLSHSEPGFFTMESEGTMILIAERAALIISANLLSEKLLESEEHYRLLAENAGDGILVFGMRGNILDANKTIETMTGIPTERFTGGEVHWDIGIHQDDRKKYMAHRTELITTHAACTIEYRYLHSDGSMRQLEQRSAPIMTASGSPKGFVCVIRDVTDRIEAEKARLGQYEQESDARRVNVLGSFAGSIAGDLGEYIADIAEKALSISEDRSSADTIQELIGAAGQASDRCRKLLLYSGTSRTSMESIDLSAQISTLKNELDTSLSEHILLQFVLEEHLPSVWADTGHLTELLSILIANAADAVGDSSGRIVVATSRRDCGSEYLRQCNVGHHLVTGAFACLEISDTGMGMDETTQDRILDPYFTTKSPGRGMGLAAASGIVRSHYGALNVFSEAGRGTTVTVLFPLDNTGRPWEGGEHRGATSSGASSCILVIEKEKLFRMFMKNVLTNAGYEALATDALTEGLLQLRQRAGDIGVILLDSALALHDGQEIIDGLRKIQPGLPIILTRTITETDDALTVMEEKVDGVLLKPFRLEDLTSLVETVLNP